MKRRWYVLPALVLLVLILGAATAPPDACAVFIHSENTGVDQADTDTLEAVRFRLEKQHLADQLTALGVSPVKAAEKIDSLSAAERNALMEQVERIQSGGAVTIDTTTLVIIVLLLIILI